MELRVSGQKRPVRGTIEAFYRALVRRTRRFSSEENTMTESIVLQGLIKTFGIRESDQNACVKSRVTEVAYGIARAAHSARKRFNNRNDELVICVSSKGRDQPWRCQSVPMDAALELLPNLADFLRRPIPEGHVRVLAWNFAQVQILPMVVALMAHPATDSSSPDQQPSKHSSATRWADSPQRKPQWQTKQVFSYD